MAELGHAAGLAQEAVEVRAAGQVSGAGHFDRHDAVQLRVTGLVHRAESADPHGVGSAEARRSP